MGDRTNVTIQISKYNYKKLLKQDFNNNKGDFKEKFDIDDLEVFTHGVSFINHEVNYANWEKLQGYLTENKIEYDKYWGSGSVYVGGEESCRIVDGEWKSVEYWDTQESEMKLVQQLKKLLDKNKIEEIKKEVDKLHEEYFPFEITPLHQPNSVRFIKDED